jgi:hypothetical protein
LCYDDDDNDDDDNDSIQFRIECIAVRRTIEVMSKEKRAINIVLGVRSGSYSLLDALSVLTPAVVFSDEGGKVTLTLCLNSVEDDGCLLLSIAFLIDSINKAE